MQSSSGQRFVTTSGGNDEVELIECEVTMSEDVQLLDEHADETLLSQGSQISVPEEEVSIWCDEKEIQNERRQALNDALGNLTSGRFSPILSTLNASWDDISSPSKSTIIIFARPGKLLQLRCQSLVVGKKKTFGNVSKIIQT